MYKCLKRIALVLLTSLMIIAPISVSTSNINQIITTFAAKRTKKSTKTKKKKKSFSTTKKSSTTKKKSSATKKSTTPKSTTAKKVIGSNNKQSNPVANSNGVTAKSLDSNSVGVWIPNTGKKYHSKSSCSRMKNPRKVSLEEAKRLGYGPCSKCMY